MLRDAERCVDAVESRVLFPGANSRWREVRGYWTLEKYLRGVARNYTAYGLDGVGETQSETRAKHLVLLRLIAVGWDSFPGNTIADRGVLRLP
jgi:hypothetical protein